MTESFGWTIPFKTVILTVVLYLFPKALQNRNNKMFSSIIPADAIAAMV